jgi:dolichyl-diphosphooligosaccharide--protein glycosyltransferase
MMKAKEIGRRVSVLLPSINTQTYVKTSIFIIIVLISISVRLNNLTLGYYLGEFDPWWHYRSAEYIMNNGIPAFLEWVDYMSWYPYGRNAAASTPIGLPLAAVALHAFLNAIGVSISLMDVAVLFPPFVSVIAVITMFFLGRELSGDDWVGLLAMLFLAANGSFIDRSHLGFFKHECLGIPLIALSSYLYLKSVRSKNASRVFAYSILSGIVLGYLCITWTAYVYVIGLIALFSTLLAPFADRDTVNRLLIAYALTIGISILMAVQLPRPGGSAVYSIYYIAVIAGFIAVLATSFLKRVEHSLTLPVLIGFAALLLSITMLLLNTNLFLSLIGKLRAVINPAERFEQPIVESVAEHRMGTWYYLFLDHGLLLVLFTVGVVSSFLSGDVVGKIFIASAGLSSLYFANMMVRIGLVFSPFLSLIAALGCYSLVSYSYPAVLEGIKVGRRVTPTRRMGFWSIVLAAILVSYMGFHGINTGIGVYGFSRSDLPSHMEQEGASSLPTSSIGSPYYFPDWIEAVTWIRYNTPPGSVILSWWDYGYWITALGERPTLIDNATINSTQVAVVGRIFMSNDTVAVPLLKRYNISYIALFNTLPLYWAMGGNVYGDEAKWRWMAAIGYNLKPVNGSYDWISDWDYTKGGYADITLSKKMQNSTLFTWHNTQVKYLPSYLSLPRADSVLTRLLVNAYLEAVQKIVPKYLGVSPRQPPEEIKLSTTPFYELVFLSPSNGFVSVYKVNYNFSYGGEFMTLGSGEGAALRNSSRFYNMPLIPSVQMAVDVKTLRMVEGEARVNNASRVLSANVSLAIRVNGEVKRLYLASTGKYILRYWNNSLQVFLNKTLLDKIPLPSDLKSVETGLILFAEGVETGSIEKSAFAYVNYEVRIELP